MNDPIYERPKSHLIHDFRVGASFFGTMVQPALPLRHYPSCKSHANPRSTFEPIGPRPPQPIAHSFLIPESISRGSGDENPPELLFLCVWTGLFLCMHASPRKGG